MSAKQPQSLDHHTKWVPLYHFALFGVLTINFLLAGWRLVTGFGLDTAWNVVMALALMGLATYARIFPLRAQDRVIRLEEQLRMERLLPGDLKARIGELRSQQYVALRFASDGELADRVREALDEKLGLKEIKQRIETWRADHHRL